MSWQSAKFCVIGATSRRRTNKPCANTDQGAIALPGTERGADVKYVEGPRRRTEKGVSLRHASSDDVGIELRGGGVTRQTQAKPKQVRSVSAFACHTQPQHHRSASIGAATGMIGTRITQSLPDEGTAVPRLYQTCTAAMGPHFFNC